MLTGVVLTQAKASLMAHDGGDGVFDEMETSETVTTVLIAAAGAAVASAVAMGVVDMVFGLIGFSVGIK